MHVQHIFITNTLSAAAVKGVLVHATFVSGTAAVSRETNTLY
jgi:hypothetical protein